MTEIEKTVPLPTVRGLPWATLKVGESFQVPLERERAVRVSASRAGRRLERVFTCRIIDGAIRVWRTE